MITREAPEQRVLLKNVGWETYERLLEAHTDESGPRFTFDAGMLEIMSPSSEHEELNRALAQIVEMIALGSGLEIRSLGSTTFRRQDLERGFEPDSCFYIQSADRIRGKAQIDSATDPPPDLVIEVDITSPSLAKLPIYARMGVAEVWRSDGARVEILALAGSGVEYSIAESSVAFPALTVEQLGRFFERGREHSLGRTGFLMEVLRWAESNKGNSSRGA